MFREGRPSPPIVHVDGEPRRQSELVRKRRNRVRSACDRCRRHKLKCGLERPCPLCLLAEVPCIPQPQRKRRVERHHENTHPSPDDTTQPNENFRINTASDKRDGVSELFEQRISSNHSTSSTRHSTAQDVEERGHLTIPGISSSYKQRTSSFGIIREIIDQFSPDMVLEGSTSALPGGRRTRAASPIHSFRAKGLEETLGLSLPSKIDMDFLLNSYLKSVHWFMMVFHESSFRARYNELLSSSHLTSSQRPFSILLLLILGMGARYADEEMIKASCPELDAEAFEKAALAKVESCLIELFDEPELESVQICVLLASFYLYNGRPNLGFVILGSGIKCAQAISLHREMASPTITDINREERRRAWWALYVYDRFASIVYGRPCGIRDEEFTVGVPHNFDDTIVEHPCFRTDAEMPNGTTKRVTLFTYVEVKIKLYRIASPIVGDMYFHRASDKSALRQKVQKIDDDLSSWFNGLPPELRLDSLSRRPDGVTADSNTGIFELQALTLQIAYDNILILLHRPLLSHTLDRPGRTLNTGTRTVPETDPGSHISTKQPELFDYSSQDKCWESAMRTSALGRYDSCLKSAKNTHAAAFLGINLLNAGMVLCVVALSKPLSEQAHTAKHAIGRIISLSRFLEGRAQLASQTSKVMRDLVRLILEKEMKAIIGDQEEKDRAKLAGALHPEEQSAHRQDGSGPENRTSDTVSMPDDLVASGRSLPEHIPAGLPGGGSRQADGNYSSVLPNFNLQDGIHSLQQAMFPDAVTEGASVDASATVFWDDNVNGREFMSSDIGRLEIGLNNLGALGQSWLWQPDQWSDQVQGFSI